LGIHVRELGMKMDILLIKVFLLWMLPLCSSMESHLVAQMNETTEKMSTKVDGHQLSYLIQVPSGQPPSEGWPLLLFLHGYGECGTDIDLVKVHGPPKRCHQIKALQQCIIVSPQCPKNSWWRVAPLKALLDEVIAQRSDINPKRIYVTGLSMGGYGTWSLLSQYPDYFTAALPICGGGNPLGLADLPSIDGNGIKNEFRPAGLKQAKGIPIWTFHGTDDPTVPISETQKLVDLLREAGAPHLKFTALKQVAHAGAWQKAYSDPSVWDWLFQQK